MQATSETRKNIRGSSLLLAGKFIALGLNFAVQVITVRYLAKDDFGAFAYAMALVVFGGRVAGLGLDKSVTRFVPIYQERGQFHKMVGTIVLVFSAIIACGISVAVATFCLRGTITQASGSSETATALLLIMVALAPMQALDNVLAKLFAIFANPGAVFFRRHLLGPGLKLCAVLALISFQGNVIFLGVAYLTTGILGTVISVFVLIYILRKHDVWQHFRAWDRKLPAKTIFSFSLPLLSSDVVYAVRSVLAVVLLGFFHSTTGVAAFRSVLPIARLNLVVFDSFKLLFVPLASRLFARDDRDGINDLYWRNASWIAVLTFPIFAVTFSLAKPTTILVLGEQYADSGSILAILSLGLFTNAAFGFNAFTLRVLGKVKAIVTVDFALIGIALALNLMLIPSYGAIGGAVASCATLVVQNICYQLILVRTGCVKPIEWRFVMVYASVVVGVTTVLATEWQFSPSAQFSLLLAAGMSLFVFLFNMRALDVQNLFPELLRLTGERRC